MRIRHTFFIYRKALVLRVNWKKEMKNLPKGDLFQGYIIRTARKNFFNFQHPFDNQLRKAVQRKDISLTVYEAKKNSTIFL